MSRWQFLPVGYLCSILIETPILMVGLSPSHPWRRRLFAGIWLVVAETFAPATECALFVAAFGGGRLWRDMAAITVANLASFVIGEMLFK